MRNAVGKRVIAMLMAMCMIAPSTSSGAFAKSKSKDTTPKSNYSVTKDHTQNPNIDFSSKELLVATEDASIFKGDDNVVSEYDCIYLLRFETEQETKDAYNYYSEVAAFVDINQNLYVAEDESQNSENEEITDEDVSDSTTEEVTEVSSEATEFITEEVTTEDATTEEVTTEEVVEEDVDNINNGDDALSTLNDIMESEENDETDYSKVIAIIDTGINGEVIDSVSMIEEEDTSDLNGHGTLMYETVKKVYPKAKIMSIKALNRDGYGQVSDIYAAIEYAINKNVSIINLSLYAFDTLNYDSIRTAIARAEELGITVVAAAGNKGLNARMFTPANITYVVTVGACDENGEILPKSNYGKVVDGYLVADSTSEAAAKMTGLIAKEGYEKAYEKLAKNQTSWIDAIIDYIDESGLFEIAKAGDVRSYIHKSETYTSTYNPSVQYREYWGDYNSNGVQDKHNLTDYFGVTRKNILDTLNENQYAYTSTPYQESYANKTGIVFNCEGFVDRVINDARKKNGLNETKISAKDNGPGWVDGVLAHSEISYRTYWAPNQDALFDTISNDGYAEPGDILWFWCGECPDSALWENGFSQAICSLHHIGIYTGNYFSTSHYFVNGKVGCYDRASMWHAIGPTSNASHTQAPLVNNGCANTYIGTKDAMTLYATVIKWADADGDVIVDKYATNDKTYGVDSNNGSPNTISISDSVIGAEYHIFQLKSIPVNFTESTTPKLSEYLRAASLYSCIVDGVDYGNLTYERLKNNQAYAAVGDGSGGYKAVKYGPILEGYDKTFTVTSEVVNGEGKKYGVANIGALEPGIWFIAETKAPDNYEIDPIIKVVRVEPNGTTHVSSYEKEDKPSHPFRIEKKAEDVSVPVYSKVNGVEVGTTNTKLTDIANKYNENYGQLSDARFTAYLVGDLSFNPIPVYLDEGCTIPATNGQLTVGVTYYTKADYAYVLIAETTAPKGWSNLDADGGTTRMAIDMSNVDTTVTSVFTLSDRFSGDPFSLSLQKKSNGDKIENAFFTIRNNDTGEEWVYKTDENGIINFWDKANLYNGNAYLGTSGNIQFYAGNYTLTETTPAVGYLAKGDYVIVNGGTVVKSGEFDGKLFDFKVVSTNDGKGTSDAQIDNVSITNEVLSINEKPKMMGFKIKKLNRDTNSNTLEGILENFTTSFDLIYLGRYIDGVNDNDEHTWYDKNRNGKIEDDEIYSKGDVVDSFTTNKDGLFELDACLEVGTYKVVETTPPVGMIADSKIDKLDIYFLDTNNLKERSTDWQVINDGTILNLQEGQYENPLINTVARGGVAGYKYDKNTHLNHAADGLTFDMIEIYVKNKNDKSVWLDTDNDSIGDTELKPDEQYMITRLSGGSSVFSTSPTLLPVGKYAIVESESINQDYSVSNKLRVDGIEFTIDNDMDYNIIALNNTDEETLKSYVTTQYQTLFDELKDTFSDAKKTKKRIVNFKRIGSSIQDVVANGNKMIGFKIQKINAETNDTVLQGKMADYTTTYDVIYIGRYTPTSIVGGGKPTIKPSTTWYDKNSNGKTDEGETFSNGEVVETITTDVNGFYQMEDLLQPGTYKIVEKIPPVGLIANSSGDVLELYFPDEQGENEYALDWLNIRGGEIVDLTTTPFKNSMARGGVAGYKYDKVLQSNEPLGGMTFDGIEIYVKNKSANFVMLDTDGDGEGDTRLNPNEKYKIYTLQNGESTFSTNPTLLPIGDYALLEAQGTNTSYIVEDNMLNEGIAFSIDGDMEYKLAVLNDTDSASLQTYVNNKYKAQFDTLKAQFSDVEKTKNRTVKYSNIGDSLLKVVANKPKMIGFEIQKKNIDTGNTDLEGNMVDYTTTLKVVYVGRYNNGTDNDANTWFDKNHNGIVDTGETFAKGETVGTFTTDASGYFKLDAYLLVGTYKVMEAVPPVGMLADSKNDKLISYFPDDSNKKEQSKDWQNATNGQIFDLTSSKPLVNSMIRGGIAGYKYDAQAGKNTPLSGFTFDGIELYVRNDNANYVMLDTDGDGIGETKLNAGETYKIYTLSGNKSVYSTMPTLLPYGNYTLLEAQGTNTDYLVSTEMSTVGISFSITEDMQYNLIVLNDDDFASLQTEINATYKAQFDELKTRFSDVDKTIPRIVKYKKIGGNLLSVISNKSRMIGFKIQKLNTDTDNTDLEGDMTDYTTTIKVVYVGRHIDGKVNDDSNTWFDKNHNGIVDADEIFEKNNTIGTFTTDSKGYFELGAYLQAGTYKVMETVPPVGMLADSKNDKLISYFPDDSNKGDISTDWQTITNGTIVDLVTTKPLVNSMIRGGIAGYKYDKVLQVNEALNGITFDGIELYVRNDNANYVMLDTDGDGIGETKLNAGETYKIYTLSGNKSVYSTMPTLLPYGNYTLLEAQGTNKDYIVSKEMSTVGISFSVTEDMQYNLVVLNNDDFVSLQTEINATYKSQFDELKTRFSDVDKTVPRIVKYKKIASTISEVISNMPKMIGFEMQKVNRDTNNTELEGIMTDYTTTFKVVYVGRYGNGTDNDSKTWYDKNKDGVVDADEIFAKGDTIDTFTTDSKGYFKLDACLLVGTYKIVETVPPTGMVADEKTDTLVVYFPDSSDKKEMATDWQTVTNGKIINLVSNPLKNTLERGGIAGYKYDESTSVNEAFDGLTFDGIEIYVRNDNANYVMLDTDGDGIGETKLNPNKTFKIYTLGDNKSVFSTNPTLLPLGTYTLLEAQGTNTDYIVSDKMKNQGITFTLTSDMQYNLLVLNDTDATSLENYVNVTYKSQIDAFKNRYTDADKTKARIIKFTKIGMNILDVVANTSKMMGFEIQKVNKDTDNTDLEGLMTDYTTTFKVVYKGRHTDGKTGNDLRTWYDKNKDGIATSDEIFKKGEAIGTFTTDSKGYFKLDACLLVGTYKIAEIVPPTGMIEDSINDTLEIYFLDKDNKKNMATDWKEISNGEIINLTKTPLKNSMIRGGIAGYKYDRSSFLSKPAKNTTFDGLEIYVRNDNANYVMLDTNGDGIGDKKLNPNEKYKIYTLKDGKSVYSTNPTLLPYGNYSLLEDQGTNEDYIVSDEMKTVGISFSITEDMQYNLSVLTDDDATSLKNYINTTYKAQFDALKTHFIDAEKKVARTVNYKVLGKDLSMVIANSGARHGVAIIKYDTDDFENATKTMKLINSIDGYPEPQGDNTLVGAVYEIYNRNNESITIDTDNDHVGDTVVEKDGLCATITTKIDKDTNIEYAATAPTLLPVGDFEIVEVTPPVGYLNEGIIRQSYTATEDGQYFIFASSDDAFETLKKVINKIYPTETYNGHIHTMKFVKENKHFANNVERGVIAIKKNDADMKNHKADKMIASKDSEYGEITNDYESKYAQGDASFLNAEYQIYNISNHYVYTYGSNNGTELKRYETAQNAFKTITGIDVNELTFTSGVYEANLNNVITDEIAKTIRTELKDSVCYTLKTDKNGKAETTKKIPCGTYLILESIPSVGYLNTVLNGGQNAKIVRISSNNEKVDLDYTVDTLERNLFEVVIRGGFEVYKYDEESKMNVPTVGGNLEASFEVINRSKDYVWVDTNEDGKYSEDEYYAPNEVVYTFKTDAKTGKFTSNNHLLPYGTYEIHETYPPKGYLHLSNINPNLSVFFEIREDGKIVNEGWYYDENGNKVPTHTHYAPIEDVFDADGNRISQSELEEKLNEVTDSRLIIYNLEIRGDFFFEKKSALDMKKMAYIPFLVTSYDEDGNAIEEHIIFTDQNGCVNTSSKYVDHTYNTNAGDEMKEWLADYKKAFDENDEELIKKMDAEYGDLVKKYASGVGTWFGLNTTASDDLRKSINDSTGALPFGIYTIEELRCPNNKIYIMVSDTIIVDSDAAYTTIDIDPEGYKNHSMHGTVNFGTIYNTANASLSTVALTKDGQSHYSYPSADMVIIDTVSYVNLVIGKKYKLVAELRDANTGEVCHDAWGNDVIVEKIFEPTVITGTVDMEIEFDASAYKNGGSVVVFEYLYDLEISDTEPLIKEVNLKNLDQQIHFPVVKSDLINQDTSNHIAKSKTDKITLIDTITFEGLEPNKTYVANSYLIDKEAIDYAKDSKGNHIVADAYDFGDIQVGKNGDGELIFKPSTPDGTFKLIYEFDASEIEGKVFVSFIEIRENQIAIAKDMDIDNESQTIYIPSVRTLAYDDETHTQMSFADGSITIVDKVFYKGVIPNEEYKVVGKLMDKSTKKPYLDADGNEIIASTTFTPLTSEGEVEVVFTFNGLGLENTTLVAFETLYMNNDYEIAQHEDIEDEDETIYIPLITTKARDSVNGTQMVNADEDVVITDTVYYENVIPNLDYKLIARLIDLDTGKTLIDGDGKEVTTTVEFTPLKSKGNQEVTFKFTRFDELEGKTTVVFEDLYVVNTNEQTSKEEIKLVARENDLANKEQTIYFPELHTTAYDSTVGLNMTKAAEAKVIDTVAYYNLEEGEYTIKGTLVDKATGEVVRVDGKPIEATKKFTVKDKNYGTVDVIFEFDATTLGNKTLVAYEELYRGKWLIQSHKDINDEAETIYIPRIGTTALDSKTNDSISLAENRVEIHDQIAYENLKVGQEYIIVGQMINKETKEPIKLINGEDFDASKLPHPLKTDIIVSDRIEDDETEIPSATPTDATPSDSTPTDTITNNGNYVVKKFTPAETNGTVEMTFIFDGTNLADNCTVAFEEIFLNGYSVAEHKDIEDEGQTITFPKVETEASNEKTGTHYSETDEKLVIVDQVKYSNLIIGRKYKVVGTLMNQSTGLPICSDKEGKNPITSTLEFIAEKSDGYVELKFELDASKLAGETVVVFEDLYQNDIKVGVHADLYDESQSIHIVEIGTTAIDSKTKSHTLASGKTVIEDKISYKGLIPNREYVLHGKLIDKETSKPLTNGDDKSKLKSLVDGLTYEANEYVAEIKFVPETSQGSITVNFEIDTTELGGKTIVVFEKLYDGSENIANHEDINSVEQTVSIPKIGTTAIDKTTNTKNLLLSEKTVIKDEVRFENLTPNVEYTIVGVLVDQSTGKIVSKATENSSDAEAEPRDGAISTMKFIPTEANGTVEMNFTIDTTDLVGKTLVVYEYLKLNEIDIAKHEDLKDALQTIYSVGVKTKAMVDGKKIAKKSKNTKIVDQVEATNLIVGQEYIIKGSLVDKKTGKKIGVNAETKFKAQKTTQIVDVTFVVDTTKYDSLVVYEELYIGNNLIASHVDINDNAQTVTFDSDTKPPSPTPTGASAIITILISIMLALISIGFFLLRRRKRFM